ncbi:Protein F39D8.3 b [Aphelenchoides avenae]|nr:Protein F39D8.3 b [Aphelenchus avenae]
MCLGNSIYCHMTFSIGMLYATCAPDAELREYQKQLKSLLVKVESALSDRDRLKAKRFIPISSSLPNRRSNYFLERIGAFRFSPSNTLPTADHEKAAAGGAPLTTTAATPPTATTTAPVTGDEKDATTAAPAASSASTVQEKQEPEGSGTTPSPAPAGSGHPAGGHHPHQHGVRTFFDPIRNHTLDECKRLSQEELVTELKRRGTYNPDLMAYDISGVLRFLDRSIVDQYERQVKSKKSSKQAVWRNVEALEKILSELNLKCDVRTPEVVSKIGNLTA